jgi:hypothetical protein
VVYPKSLQHGQGCIKNLLAQKLSPVSNQYVDDLYRAFVFDHDREVV